MSDFEDDDASDNEFLDFEDEESELEALLEEDARFRQRELYEYGRLKGWF